MDSVAETSHEPRKEWTKPELKKIDIEQITASHPGHGGDGFHPSKSQGRNS